MSGALMKLRARRVTPLPEQRPQSWSAPARRSPPFQRHVDRSLMKNFTVTISSAVAIIPRRLLAPSASSRRRVTQRWEDKRHEPVEVASDGIATEFMKDARRLHGGLRRVGALQGSSPGGPA